MSDTYVKEPTQAWVTTFAGMAINLCLGILYAWSMWGGALVSEMTLSAGDIVTSSKVISAAQAQKNAYAVQPGDIVVKPANALSRAEALKVKFGTASKEGYALLSEVIQKGEALKAGDIITHAGEPMSDPKNAGWLYLNNAEAATPFSLCVIMFALLMIPGGKIQDRISPKFGATLGGLFLAAGCIIAGLMKSYAGLIIGFGILGGMGMGIGYAAPTPAALKWFGPHRRGLIAGLVVGGYGGAALYIGPLAKYLIGEFGLTQSFVILGIGFATIVIVAGQLIKIPPPGYVPAPPRVAQTAKQLAASTKHNWEAGEMVKTWQFYALVFMFILTTQSGLLIIANAAGLLSKTGAKIPFFAENAWLLVSFGGLINASGRGHRLLLGQDRKAERLLSELRSLRPVSVPPALHHSVREHPAAFPGSRRRLLAVRRRVGPDAVVRRGFLRAQEPGFQLRPGVHRLGPRHVHGAPGRNHQGPDRELELRLLHFRRAAGHQRRAGARH